MLSVWWKPVLTYLNIFNSYGCFPAVNLFFKKQIKSIDVSIFSFVNTVKYAENIQIQGKKV